MRAGEKCASYFLSRPAMILVTSVVDMAIKSGAFGKGVGNSGNNVALRASETTRELIRCRISTGLYHRP